MGALCAEANDTLVESFSTLGELLGIAGQLDNDAHDLSFLLQNTPPDDFSNGAGAGASVDEYLLDTMPALADGLSPTHDTLQKLVGRTIETVDEAVLACREIIRGGPQVVLVKQLIDRNSPADRVNLLIVTEREAWMTQHPRYPFARQPVGVGELTSATFVARRLAGDPLRTAFEHAVSAVHAVLKATYAAGHYELR